MALPSYLKTMSGAKKVVGKSPTGTAKKPPKTTLSGPSYGPGAPPPPPLAKLPIVGPAAQRATAPTIGPPPITTPIIPAGLQGRSAMPGGGVSAPTSYPGAALSYSAASTGGSGGSTNGGGPTNTNPTDGNPGGASDGQVYDGWAKNVRPGAVPGLFQDPTALLAQVMAQMGISSNTNPGLYGMAAPFADYANALTLLGLGTGGVEQMGNNDALNYMGNYFSNLLTRGARGADFGGAMDAIRGAGATTDSPLAAYLNIDDPGGQADAYKSLMMPAAAASLHPLAARALSDKLDMLKTQYQQRAGWSENPPASFGAMLNGPFFGR